MSLISDSLTTGLQMQPPGVQMHPNVIGTARGPVYDGSVSQAANPRLRLTILEVENGYLVEVNDVVPTAAHRTMFVAASLEQLPETMMQAIAASKLRR